MPISPGVYSKIIDLSYYLQEVPGTTGFVPFFSKRGPDNELVLINGQKHFNQLFGKPNVNDFGKTYGQGPYMAWNHLGVSGACYGMRVLPDDATYANIVLSYDSDSTGSMVISHSTNVRSLSNDIEKDAQLQSQSNLYPIVIFWPLGRGDYYHDYAITLTAHTNPVLAEDGVYVLNIYKTSDDGEVDEIQESFEISFNENAVDESGDSIYLPDVVNRYSLFLKCHTNSSHIAKWQNESDIDAIVESDVENPNIPNSYAIHFYAGTEGNLWVTDVDTGQVVLNTNDPIDGNIPDTLLSNAYYGLIDSKVLDLDEIYFSICYDGGYPTNVKDSLFWLVHDWRRDCVGIIDNGDNPSVETSITTRTDDNQYNSFLVSIYEPYTKIFDRHTGKETWVSPVQHLSRMLPLTDKLQAIWYPSAGFNRGQISGIRDMRFNPQVTERDQLYLKQINPIVKFNIGHTLWGNLTAQKRPSKLSNLSTVRTVLYIKRTLEQFTKWYIFEFNDKETHSQIASEIQLFLQTIQDARALEGYSVEVGATEYEKKQKICHVNVTLIPTSIIERIHLNLFIQ